MQRQRRRSQRGFTLIELLIVVAIIGIVAAIAVPALMNSLDRAKQSATVADLKAISGALERYMVDNQCYPDVTDMNALRAELQGSYIKQLPTTDRWRNAYVYKVSGDSQQGYTLISPGKGGQLQANPAGGTTNNFSDDIIIVDGALVQRPQGQQQ